MGNEKNNYILLIIIAVVTLLVAVAGATFAYFGATGKSNGEAKTIEVTSGTLTIDFLDNSKIINVGALPGDVIATKKFTVKGVITGSNDLDYFVSMNIENNSYSEGSLVYKITGENENSNGVLMPAIVDGKTVTGSNFSLGDGKFVGPISNGAIHSYTLSVIYVGEAQVDSSFNATISIVQKTN